MFNTKFEFWSSTTACMLYDNAWLISILGIICALLVLLVFIRKMKTDKEIRKRYFKTLLGISLGSIALTIITMAIVRLIFYQPNYWEYERMQKQVAEHIKEHKI